MNEEAARGWVHERYGAEAVVRLALLVARVTDENGRQNLVSESTLSMMWSRHVVDSAQLLPMAEAHRGLWLDVGTGAGFPGMVIACLRAGPIELVEPRARRAAFLAATADALGLRHVRVIQATVERTTATPAGIITARAVASLDKLFTLTAHRRADETIYLLPKGVRAGEEVERASARWQGMFHVEHSITDPASFIVRASGVRLRCTG